MDALSADFAADLDRQDELAPFRDQFVSAEPGLIYLDGNSLGRLPRRAAERVRVAVEDEWGRRLIRGWNEGWFTAARRLGAQIAGLIGAGADDVIVSDSTSVNFFKLAAAALAARPGRRVIVTDDLNFPSDLYLLQGVARLLNQGHTLRVVHSPDGLSVPLEALAAAVQPDTALVALSHVAYRSGFLYDLPAVTALTQAAGALMLWDLSHSAGAVPVDLAAANVDLAVGCTYKYLNGGPGAPAYLYVRGDWQAELLNPIWGWFGQRDQFAMAPDYAPAPGLERFLVGTPPVLSLAAIEAGVELVRAAGPERLRAKSMRLSQYLLTLWRAWLEPLGVTLNSPADPARRGSHVALGHPDGWRINRALIESMHVIPDFRPPDSIRLGLAPLYTSFADVHEALRRFRQVLAEGRHAAYPAGRPAVT